jgi:hypothetical protein
MSCIRSCYDKGSTNFGHEDCTTCIHGDRPPKPKREPLTIEQLRDHWQVAKVLDMTDAEIDFADYVLIARDVEALYGITGDQE